MYRRPAISRRALLGALLIGIVVIASFYAMFVAISEGIGAAATPIIIASVFGFNCILFFAGRAFPKRD
jgi:hypothetical protein